MPAETSPTSPTEAVSSTTRASPGAEIDKEVASELPHPASAEQPSREERIRRAAYRRYEQRGNGEGDAESDWRAAEQEIGGHS